MMFQTGNLKTTPPVTKPNTRPAELAGSSTMVFGHSPVPAVKPPATPTAKPKPEAPEGGAGATMVFGQSPIAAPKRAAMPPSARAQAWAREPKPEAAAQPEANTEENEAQAREEATAGAEAAAEVDASLPPTPPEETGQQAESVSDEGSIQAEGADEQPAAEGTFDKAPPKGLLIGVAAGLAMIVLIGGGLVLWKKMGKHGPPPAAMETLATATSAADKDTMASLADAESKAKDALDVAGPKSHFPQAVATLARIEIQWSDALNDQASYWTDKGQKAAEAGNDAKKTEAESKAAELQNQAKARLKIAFDTVAPAIKADPKSAELELALADYYRAQRSNSSLNRELKKAQALQVEEPRIALVQGLAAAQDEEGAEKAIPKLKTALNANANSARIRFRLAMAYLAAKDNDNAMKELKETLRISPQHERAKMAMEQLAAATVEQK
jgi:Tfp pilus assembly protein PilF